jgi:hypothetical protein
MEPTTLIPVPISLKHREERRSTPRPCRNCGEPNWTPAHNFACTSKGKNKNVISVNASKQSKDVAVAANIIEGVDTDMDRVLYDNSDCKYQKGTLNNEVKNNYAFRMLTPMMVNGVKLAGRIETGSDTTLINLDSLNKKLNINKIHNFGSTTKLQFLFDDSKVKSLGTTGLLNIKHANGIYFEHSMEILDFHKTFDFDILLGKDILPQNEYRVNWCCISFRW